MKQKLQPICQNTSINYKPSQKEKNQQLNCKHQISVIPDHVLFNDIQIHQLYETIIFVRNQTKQTKKIRVIQPLETQFKLKYDQKIKQIAPGLCFKITIMFCANQVKEFSDKFTIIGDNFKIQLPLQGSFPKVQFSIPQVFNLGVISTNQEHKFKIPIKNIGKKTGAIGIKKIEQSTSNCTITPIGKKINILQGMTEKFQILVKKKKNGEFSNRIDFNNGQSCEVKGIAIDQQIQLLQANGSKLLMKDFGQIIVGEGIKLPFSLLNNTSQKIQCLFKTFNKNKEGLDLKIDEQRLNFISKLSPKQYSKEFSTCCTIVKNQHAFIDPFKDFQNLLEIVRKPSLQEEKTFKQNLFCVLQAQENYTDPKTTSLRNCTPQRQTNQHNQTLVVKIINQDKMLKVPIKFVSHLPKITISKNIFEFGKIEQRESLQTFFTIENHSKKGISLSWEEGIKKNQTFFIQGPTFLKQNQLGQYTITFRPLIKKKFEQTLKIKIFNSFSIQLKMFAECIGLDHLNFTMRDRKNTTSWGKVMISNRTMCSQLSSPQKLKISPNLTMTKSSSTAFLIRQKSQNMKTQAEQYPFELLKSARTNLLNEKVQKSELFFKKEQYLRSIRKNKINTSSNHPINLREMLKYNKLQLTQLQKIQVSQTKVDYGHIFIGSNSVKSVFITNKNQQTVLLQIDTDNYKPLQETKIQIIKLQGFSTYQLKIHLTPAQLGTIEVPLKYIINRQHVFQIQISALVTLVNLELSSKAFNFSITEQDKVFQKSQQLKIYNKGNAKTKFIFMQPQNKSFKISLMEAELQPRSYINVSIIYCPDDGDQSGQQRIDVQKVKMRVVGGAENIIKCSGTVSQPKITIKQTQINFQNILISSFVNSKITLKNTSKVPTIFKIQFQSQKKLNLSQYFTIDQSVMTLLVDQKKQISFSFLSHEVKRFEGFMIIKIRGMKNIRIPIDINVIYPQIICNKTQIDFGVVPILSNMCVQNLTLTNKTNTQIRIQINSEYPKDQYSFQVFPSKQQNFQITFSEDKAKSFYNTFSSTFKEDRFSHRHSIQGYRYLKLAPGVETSFQIKFIPKLIKKYNFQIPIKISGTSKTVLPLKTNIICKAIQPIIYVSPQSINFQTKIICQTKTTYSKKLQIFNPHQQVSEWRIESQSSSQNKNSQFSFSEWSGVIEAKGKASINAIFKPQKEGPCNQKFNIFLGDKKLQSFSLQVSGIAILPTIKFNCNEAIMPVVPLNIQSRIFVIIQNHGYDAITICKWKTSNHFQYIDIKVNFIEGKLLSLAKKCLRVEILFTSMIAISLTTMLEFYDQFGNKYDLPLSCTADNSVMTVYPYLESDNQHMIVYDNHDKIIKAVSTGKNSYYEGSKNLSGIHKMSCQFIKKWINFELSMNVKEFPQSMIQSDGQGFSKLLNRISGKAIVKKLQLDADKQIKNIELHEIYSEAIRYLKCEGAFLNNIRPEFLLSYTGYVLHQNSAKLLILSQSSFDVISVQSWISLFYQLCKLYICPQINQKLISKLGLSKINQNSSTIYSQSEMFLLNFINNQLGEQNLINFNDQMKIYEVIQKILENTFQLSLSQQLNSLKVSVSAMSPHVVLSSISKLLHNHLKQFGLSLYLEPNDLFTIGVKQLCIYFVNLLQMIYNYSNSSSIKFQASIGDKITKIIQLQNPSNRKMNYLVKIIGGSSFIPESKTISIDPKQKKQAKIIYQCKQTKQETANLYFVPAKDQDGSVCATPLLFKLSTSIISKVIVKKMNISANLYDVIPIHLDIEIPAQIPQFAQFNLLIHQENISNGKQQPNSTPSFLFHQSNIRTLKQNRDSLDLKLVPLTMHQKFCKISYISSIFGQFIYEIRAKIQLPKILREYKVKQFKVNKQEEFSIIIQKDNQLFINAQKQSYEGFKTDRGTKKQLTVSSINNKYELSILESSYITLAKDCQSIDKCFQNKQPAKITLNANFSKPYKEYSCILMMKNEQLRDLRLYKITTMVVALPKIVKLQFKIPARKTIVQKIPTKLAPCDISLKSSCQAFSLSNFSQQLFQNTDLIATFSPQWILDDQVTITITNKQSLEQLVYIISLKAEQPQKIGSIQIIASQIFNKNVQIPVNILTNAISPHTKQINEKLIIKRFFKRSHELPQGQIFNSISKKFSIIMHPSQFQENGVIKLFKPKTQQYYWLTISIKNAPLITMPQMEINQKINQPKRLIFDQTNCMSINCSDKTYKYEFKNQANIIYEQMGQKSNKKPSILFIPQKQMNKQKQFYYSIDEKQYVIPIGFRVDPFPSIHLPDMSTKNTMQKQTTINLINPISIQGVYKILIPRDSCFSISQNQIFLKPKQKIQLKIAYTPTYIGHKQKVKIQFQSQTLPNYAYIINGKSEFVPQEKFIEFQIFQDHQVDKVLEFKNLFNKKQHFNLEMKCQNDIFEIVEPLNKKFVLDPSASKFIAVRTKQNSIQKIQNIKSFQGKLIVKIGDKLIQTFNFSVLVIKTFIQKKFTWNCKARQTIYQNIPIPQKMSFMLKDLQADKSIQKYLSFTTEQSINTTYLKIKYSPMKPIRKNTFNIILVGEEEKYKITCQINVQECQIDDTIVIKTTQIDETGAVVFKLTNTAKNAAKYKGYFLKNLPQFQLQSETGLLDGYGKLGTPITVKYKSHINNRRLEDILVIETEQMYWRFKVKGLLSKDKLKA